VPVEDHVNSEYGDEYKDRVVEEMKEKIIANLTIAISFLTFLGFPI